MYRRYVLFYVVIVCRAHPCRSDGGVWSACLPVGRDDDPMT